MFLRKIISVTASVVFLFISVNTTPTFIKSENAINVYKLAPHSEFESEILADEALLDDDRGDEVRDAIVLGPGNSFDSTAVLKDIRQLIGWFTEVAVPKGFAPALEPSGFVPEKVEVLRLNGEGAVAGLLSDPFNSFAVSSSLSQAVGSILFAGQGKDVKEVADGNAVHFTERAIEYFAETHDKVAIVILADEGGRDDSFALPIGRVYYSEKADGKRNLKKIDFQGVTSLKGELGVLRTRGFKILYFVGDALENTNGLIVPQAATKATDSTSLFSLFIEDDTSRLDGKNRFLVHDKHWRVGGVSFNAPDDAGVDPFDLPSVALPKIAASNAKAKGLKEGTPAFNAFVRKYIENTIILALGPREADLEKDAAKAASEHRHKAIIDDAKALQASYPDLKLQFPGDGDCLPRIVASLGLNLDGRHLVVFGRSGSAEGIASTIPVADQKDAQFVHAIVAKKATDGGKDGKFARENAHNYTGEELGTYSDLGIVGDGFNQVTKPARSKADIEGKGILATTSVTGASSGQFGETFANIFQRVKFESTKGREGVAVTNTLLVTPQGAFIVRTTFKLPNFEKTRRDVLLASHAARQYDRAKRAAVDAPAVDDVGGREVSELKAHLSELLNANGLGQPTARTLAESP